MMVWGVDFTFGFVEDDNIFDVAVWHEEVVFVFDLTVEWISEWQIVHVAGAATDSSADNMVVVVFDLLVWADVDVELVDLSTNLAHGEGETFWEGAVSFAHVQVEFFLAVDGSHNVLVQGTVAGAVLDGVVVLLAVTFDDVLAGLEGVDEFVQFNEVDAVFVQWDFVSLFVVFWSVEYADNYIGSLVGLNMDLVGEWFVVEAVLTSPNLEFFWGEFVSIFVFVGVQSVGDFKVEAIEVGDEFVKFNIFYFNSWVVQFGVGVVWQVALVLQEVVGDALVELVEDWVTESGFEVFHGAWVDLVGVEFVGGVSKNLVGNYLKVTIETVVWTVWVRFNDLAE